MSEDINPKQRAQKLRSLISVQPLECRHYKYRSEIVAQMEAGSEWKVIAKFYNIPGTNAELMAQYVCQLIDDNLNNKDILRDAMVALELCLKEANLTFSSEQAADRVVTDLKKAGL